MGAHPSGDGASWLDTELVDVDRPHGLDQRFVTHVAKAVRKRLQKEHVTFADDTVGGEHVPGYAQVLKQVDGTADVSGAKDNTLFQNNGLVHSSGNQTLWCITGAASDPTIMLIDPDKQYKGGDITWLGAQQFDASIDATIIKCVSGTFQILVVESSANIHGPADMSDTQIDGTLTVLDRADFSSIGVAGDSTITGEMQFGGAAKFTAGATFDSSVAIGGLLTAGAQNVYDSTWFDCSNAGSYAKTHDLSSTALLFQTFFKDTGNGLNMGANAVYECYHYKREDAEYGPAIRAITTTQFTVQAGQDMVVTTWNATGVHAFCATGQYRVIAIRLI